MRINVKLILFFNKCFTNVENRYWFTKLKIVNLIWTIRRVRYIMKIAIHFVIVYTNYFVTITIVQQIKLFILFVNKLNLRFVRIFTYFFQFILNVRYKFDIQHIVFNVLLRLLIDNAKLFFDSMLNDVYLLKVIFKQLIDEIELIYSKHAITNIHVQMFFEFKKIIVKKYKNDKSWKQIRNLIANQQQIILIKKKIKKNYKN